MNINAVDVFEPMGASPIPTDICLVGLDDDSIDEFDTPMRDTVPSTYAVDFNDTPCQAEDPYNDFDDDIDRVRALVDTGAMVTCTGQQHIIHGYSAYTKLRPCPIRLKAALDENKSVIPLGHGFLRCRSADGHGYRDVHVYSIRQHPPHRLLRCQANHHRLK